MTQVAACDSLWSDLVRKTYILVIIAQKGSFRRKTSSHSLTHSAYYDICILVCCQCKRFYYLSAYPAGGVLSSPVSVTHSLTSVWSVRNVWSLLGLVWAVVQGNWEYGVCEGFMDDESQSCCDWMIVVLKEMHKNTDRETHTHSGRIVALVSVSPTIRFIIAKCTIRWPLSVSLQLKFQFLNFWLILYVVIATYVNTIEIKY